MDRAIAELRAGAWVTERGVAIRVFAPERERVEVVLYAKDGETAASTVELEKGADGFFSGTLAGAGPGALYKLRIDGAGPFPDPLSRSQPRGVHGPSEVIDHHFAWTDGGWRGVSLEDLVVYELHVGTATPEGTFDGLIKKLGALRSLGVTALELLPIASFPGRRNWGYDGVGLFAPAAMYGGPAGLRRLINAAHAEGLGVLIDVVYNHLGPDGNYFGAVSRHYFKEGVKTPWGEAWDLDGERSAPVRELMLANAEMWIRDYHADGLRLDATHAIFDASEPHILRSIAERARAAGGGRRHVLVVAEDERNDARLVTPVASGGLGLDGVWADDFHHQVRRAFAGDSDGYYSDYTGSTEDIAATLRGGWYYRGQASNHLKKPRGTAPEGVDLPRFIYCIQNHDQVGNRALGDRLGERVSPAGQRAMSALLLLSPYTPMLFMGQEWDASTPFLYFTDHGEELGRAVTEGRRREFEHFEAFKSVTVPDPQDEATFERSKLRWEEAAEPGKREMLEWYRELLALRASHPCMKERGRDAFAAGAIGPKAVLLERRCGDTSVLMFVNIDGKLEASIGGEAGEARVLLWSEEARFGGAGGAEGPLRDGRVSIEGPGALVVEVAARSRRENAP